MLDFKLRSFLAVCEERSYSRAAERLHLTQPAVSKHVKDLETRFGVRLLDYKNRSLSLTSEGALLHRYASRAAADGRLTEALMRAQSSRLPLRFGATRTIGEYVLPRCLAEYLKAYPDSDLSVRVDNTEALLQALKEGTIDFAFIEGIFDSEEYATHLFMRAAFIPVCGGSDPLASTRVDYQAIFQRRLIVRERGSGSRLLLERTLEGSNRRIEHFSRVLELGNLEAIKRLVSESLGVAFLYEHSVDRELDNGTLRPIELEGFPVHHDYSFVFLKGSLYAERYVAFLQFCRESGSIPSGAISAGE